MNQLDEVLSAINKEVKLNQSLFFYCVTMDFITNLLRLAKKDPLGFYCFCNDEVVIP